jgi:IS605 OrfB family transposase
MGLSNLIATSNKKIVEHQKFLRKYEKRLAIEQRKLSKKQRYEKEIEVVDKEESKKVSKIESKKQGKKVNVEVKKKEKIKVNSKNREKQRIKVAKIHRKIANQRRNFNHNISRTLVDNFDIIVFEKLNIQQMMSNHHYAKSIADAGWYQLQIFTNYKAEWAGKLVDFVDPVNTTKECSKCGKINDMPIWKRTMICSCGNIEDRDIDASCVIRDRSVIYQELKKKILEKIRSEKEENISRDAIARIQAFGDETSTQTAKAVTQSNEQVFSVNQETLSSTKGGNLADTSMQAPPRNQRACELSTYADTSAIFRAG